MSILEKQFIRKIQSSLEGLSENSWVFKHSNTGSAVNVNIPDLFVFINGMACCLEVKSDRLSLVRSKKGFAQLNMLIALCRIQLPATFVYKENSHIVLNSIKREYVDNEIKTSENLAAAFLAMNMDLLDVFSSARIEL